MTDPALRPSIFWIPRRTSPAIRAFQIACAIICWVPAVSAVIRRTKALTEFLALDLAAKARQTMGRTGVQLVARAASFMLLADSRASFEIEGERPPRNRLERWGRAVLEAGKHRLTVDEIVRLHRVLI